MPSTSAVQSNPGGGRLRLLLDDDDDDDPTTEREETVGGRGRSVLDTDSLVDPTDRNFGIESSNLLQEYYPSCVPLSTPRRHVPTAPVGETLTPRRGGGRPMLLTCKGLSFAPSSVPRPRARSANPAMRMLQQVRASTPFMWLTPTTTQKQPMPDLAIHSLVPFDNNDESCPTTPVVVQSPPPPRKKMLDVKIPQKPQTNEDAPSTTTTMDPLPTMLLSPPRTPRKPRPSTGGPERRRMQEAVWTSSQRISTTHERRQSRSSFLERHAKPAVAPPRRPAPGTTMVVDLVDQVRRDVAFTLQTGSMRVSEEPKVVVKKVRPLRPASADATHAGSRAKPETDEWPHSTKELVQRHHELQVHIHRHRSTEPKSQAPPGKNILLKMYCVLDECKGREGKHVNRLKQKPEIPMQKTGFNRQRRTLVMGAIYPPAGS
ncbi:Aste57867_9836 [Aphanomyces stellatus]|uniref:Aste57867_9836 protein n=1 Tax=Aphanomyces stellatus TaxID=120398 RepID=A0A485KPB0_9STRA|nr:hypothetical protein As57867_009797 [Aphanomyces stellatus]VFT86715.1 Aste57867_9836 [Aphanomyces stellatus]